MEKWLVIGGDGLIGSYLQSFFLRPDIQLYSTSRNKNTRSGTVFLDLGPKKNDSVLDIEPDVVFFCAAMTNMEACENRPEESWRINVDNTVQLASNLMDNGSFVVFLSSNTVFNGASPFFQEDAIPCPVNTYGRQKAETEKRILSYRSKKDGRGCVVRMSKVLSPVSGIAAEFLKKLKKGEPFQAFQDLKISPVSLGYLAAGLENIARGRHSGIFHLSGVEELSYDAFCRRMALAGKLNQNLVQSISASDIGITPLFNPVYPALGMKNTTKILGIEGQSLDSVFKDFFNSNRINDRREKWWA